MFPRFIFVLAAILLFISSHSELSSQDVQSPVQAQLISEVKSIQPGVPFWIALHLQMKEHWHTYWKNPGDSGLATKIDWALPEGFTAGEILWPYPQRIETPPLVSFGYEGEVLLLTKISVDQLMESGVKKEIKAKADWLMCREECIPGKAELSLELQVSAQKPKMNETWATAFAAARLKLPQEIPGWKVNASVDDTQIRIQIVPPAGFTRDLLSIQFFPEQQGLINHEKPSQYRKTDIGYFLEIPRSLLIEKAPTRLIGVLYSAKGWDEDASFKALALDVPLHRLNIKPPDY